MKISLQWLNTYIDIQDYFSKPQDLAALLTAAGIEVEGIENRAKQFEHVVVGSVLEKGQHPNADRLSLCQFSTGDGVVHQIVCGAKNHKEGDRVVVALPGAVLPGDFVIQQSKIRGVESGGMLCSEKELGLKSESDGILILPSDAPVGQPFAKYFGFDDILFELKVTPNRADCLSHYGLAREIGSVLGRDVEFPVESLSAENENQFDSVSVDLRAQDLCPRYAGRGMMGVKVGPSPDWLKRRLEAVGMNSINNVVDVTNFVMMELGQPLHAFDVRELKGRKVIIDRASPNEKFVTLDGTELVFDGSELTIRDGERAVALAGIIGGQNSGISDDTTEIFIESAYFVPAAIRRTARKFGIETDSCYRFSRGTNPEAVLLAMNRAAQLIQEVAGGKVLGDVQDVYPNPLQREAIEIDLMTLEARLGYGVDSSEFVDWMKRLGCGIETISTEGEKALRWRVQPPVFRWDLTIEMDLVEEFARLHGYQHIPEALPALVHMPSRHDQSYIFENRLRRLLQGNGCLQAINYAFVSKSFQDEFLGDSSQFLDTGLRMSEAPIALMNPLNEEINVMRLSLLPGLMKNVVYNTRHGNAFGRLFEIGQAHVVGNDINNKYLQEARLGFAFWGQPKDLWRSSVEVPVIYSLKGVIENLLKELNILRWRWSQYSAVGAESGSRVLRKFPKFLHPGQACLLQVAGFSEGKASDGAAGDWRTVGFIGTLHPNLSEEDKIRESCALGELNLDKLMALAVQGVRYRGVSKFPAMDRDVAFLMPNDLPAQEVEFEIRKLAGELLQEVKIFDVYQGGELPAGQRSVGFRMVFQAKGSTLEDQVINDLRDRIVSGLVDKFKVQLRG